MFLVKKNMNTVSGVPEIDSKFDDNSPYPAFDIFVKDGQPYILVADKNGDLRVVLYSYLSIYEEPPKKTKEKPSE